MQTWFNGKNNPSMFKESIEGKEEEKEQKLKRGLQPRV